MVANLAFVIRDDRKNSSRQRALLHYTGASSVFAVIIMGPIKTELISFDAFSYLNLATFRKTGTEVRTPVWFARDAERIYIFSSGNAGKVKRLRNSSRARIAPCDVRGKILGEWADADAFLIDDKNEIARADAAFRKKYGWISVVTDFFAGLSGRRKQRAYIVVLESAGREKDGRAD